MSEFAWTDPGAITGMARHTAVPHVAPVTAQAVPAGVAPAALSPSNPMVWLAGIAAVTVGLVAVSGSVRLGRAKVSASVGKS